MPAQKPQRKLEQGMTGVLPQLDFKQKPIAEVAKLINDNMLIVIMLESPEAISNVDSIAAVEGVDVILIGTNDLCMEMGIPGDYNNPKVKEAYRKVIGQLGRQHLRHQVAASHLINPRQRPGRTFQITTLHLGAHHVIAA